MRIHCGGCPDCRKMNIEVLNDKIQDAQKEVEKATTLHDVFYWNGYKKALKQAIALIELEVY